jgi:hypothetical protein
MALTSQKHLPSRQPKVFVQYRCQQGHYFITLKVFDGESYQEHYITPSEQSPDITASAN